MNAPLRCSFGLFGLLSLCSLAYAAPVKLTVTVDAGKHDRTNTPVKVAIDLPASAKPEALKATLAGPAGEKIVGQVTGPGLLAKAGTKAELHFVIPSLKAGQKGTFTATLEDGYKPAETDYSWKQEGTDYYQLSRDGKAVLRYMCLPYNAEKPTDNYKVFHHVYDPTGKVQLTKGPGSQFPHHRGIYFGFNKVTLPNGKMCDVWHCTKGAHQGHVQVVSSDAGPVLGRHVVEIGWFSDAKTQCATELRELTVYAVPGGQSIEFASKVSVKEGPVMLDGDPQHAGFHYRAAAEVAEKTAKQTYYLRPDGKDKPDATRNWPGQKMHVNLPWNAMSFMVEGNRYTVAYLDRPENPKEARFSERNYGRFGSYFEYKLTPETPLVVNYRLWVQPGEMTGEGVAALASDFVEPPAVSAAGS